MSDYGDDAFSTTPTGGEGFNLDALSEWLGRHPEIAEIIVTEVVTTTIINELPHPDR